MPHVVTDNCQRCRYTECVAVCPVECFHYDDEMMYIDPNMCIDCGGCIPACPVNAIYDTFNLPEEKNHWVEINENKSTNGLPVLTATMEPLPTASDRKKKLGFDS